jgi:hypothetical protein
MSIEQLFLSYKGIGLYTTIMKPDIVYKQEGYVIVHPFAEEKKSAHRILFEIANAIVEQGFHVVMFDFSGCGDSGGSLLTTTLDDWFEELDFVSKNFKVKYSLNKINYLGLRLGAFIAGIYCSNPTNDYKTIMLEPVIQTEEYFKKILKSKLFKELLTQGNISSKRNELIEDLKEGRFLDFDGHEIGGAFYKSIVGHKEDIKYVNAEITFVVNISITGKPSKEYQKLILDGVFKNKNFTTIKLEPFWDRIESTPEVGELKKIIINAI